MIPICDNVKRISGRNSRAEFELIFEAENLPALGFKRYFIERTENKKKLELDEIVTHNPITISNTEVRE